MDKENGKTSDVEACTEPISKNWVYKPTPPTQEVERLQKSINVNPYLSYLLVQRGITDIETAKHFFRPSLDRLHDPFSIRDMDRAVSRLRQALDRREKILIYGDYDVDGVTSVALVYRYLSRFYDLCDYYLPDRFTEGYGLSRQGVEWASLHGFALILALDVGVRDVDTVALARQKGIDVIICDHHLPGPALPEAVALIDPKRDDCDYPFKELSGCGLGFKLIQAFAQTYRSQDDVMEYIDLVAMSIAADIVPIYGENRILTHYGLRKINKNPLCGIKALKEVSGIDGDMSVSEVLFGLGPRINAAGRVAHAREAVALLVTDCEEEAAQRAQRLNEHNQLRQQWDTTTTEEAFSMIDQWASPPSAAIVLAGKDWKKGIVGIVAARCVETYYRPTIVLTSSNEDEMVGSGRSVQGFNLYQAVCACGELLSRFGGHRQAVGLALKKDRVADFRRQFESVVDATLTEAQRKPVLEIDMPLPLYVITPRFMAILRQMAPFGPSHPKPVFVARNILPHAPALIKDRHIRFWARQRDGDFRMSAVGFDMAYHYRPLSEGRRLDMAFTIEENTFLGKTDIELRIRDIKFENDATS